MLSGTPLCNWAPFCSMLWVHELWHTHHLGPSAYVGKEQIHFEPLASKPDCPVATCCVVNPEGM